MSLKNSNYVLVTPVKDEEEHISETIDSVVCQTHLPKQWIIVSDGSTDRTEQIVKSAAVNHLFIKLITLPVRATRSFASVVHSTETGVRNITTEDYRFIGLLDGDVRFRPDYFSQLIGHFEANPRLGLAGGMVVDLGDKKNRPPRNLQEVPGASQFFLRTCFEALGGLLPIPEGGWDALTCARARMLGYETSLFPELVVEHLKPRNKAEGGLLKRKWQLGVRDYALGYEPVFEFLKCLSRFLDKPAFIGALAWFMGYSWACLRRPNRIIPEQLLRFIRTEQRQRLRNALRNE